MPLLIACPDCEADNRVDEELKGKNAKCKECGSTFKVGKDAKFVEMNESERKKADDDERKSKKKSKRDDLDDEDDDDRGKRKRNRDDDDDDDRGKRRRSRDDDDEDRPRRPGVVAPRGYTRDGSHINRKAAAGIGGVFSVIVIGIMIWQFSKKSDPPKPPSNNSTDQSAKKPEFDVNLDALNGPNPTRNNAGFFVNAPINPERQAEVARTLEKNLKSADKWLAADACQALQRWGDKESIKPISDFFLGNPDHGDRAVDALGKIQDAASAKALIDLLKTNPRNKGRIYDNLKKVGKAGEGEVVALLNDEDQQVQMKALDILKAIGTKQSLPALSAFLEANKPTGKNRPSDAYKQADGAIKAINLRGV